MSQEQNEQNTGPTQLLAPDKKIRTVLGVRTCDCGIQGPESLILALSKWLMHRNVRYVVANIWDGVPPTVALHEELVRGGKESHVVRTSWGKSPRIITKLAALIREIQPDVVHTHDVKADFAAAAALFGRRCPLITSYYGRLMINSLFLKAVDIARFGFFQVCDRVLANSEAQRAELLRFRVPARRVAIVPSFVDASQVRPPSPEETAAARRQLGIGPSHPVLATIARLSLNKGHTFMLQALPELVRKFPGILYLVPGEGDMAWRGEGGLRNELERQARDLGVAEHVRFLGYCPDVRVVLHATDLVVSPSLLEGMQVALLEAMAAARPIVATAIGGTPDAVVHSETGILVPPADPAALAAAIESLLQNPASLVRLGNAGRKRIEEKFDAPIIADQFLQICADAAATR